MEDTYFAINLGHFRVMEDTYFAINLGHFRVRGGAVGWGTALQTKRSRVRFPKGDLILPAALGPEVDSASNRNEYQGYILGADNLTTFNEYQGYILGADNLTIFNCRLLTDSGSLNLPEC